MSTQKNVAFTAPDTHNTYMHASFSYTHVSIQPADKAV